MAVKLIVGLGNPGLSYAHTRHNIGFDIVQALAQKFGISWKNENRFSGKIALGELWGKSTILLQPMTYMNLSGESVQKVANFYKLKTEEILVVVDDVALDFGALRLRKVGSAGGHNGLLSIQRHLNSQNYLRLRVGIGDRDEGPLESHVLGKFTKDEKVLVPKMIERSIDALQLVLDVGIDDAMNRINVKMNGPGCG